MGSSSPGAKDARAGRCSVFVCLRVGLLFRAWDLGYGVQGLGFRAEFGIKDMGSRDDRVWRVVGLSFVQALGFRVSKS